MVFGANCPTSGTAPPKPRGGRTRTAATSPGAPVRSDTRLDVDLTEVLVISGAACSSIGRGSGAGIGTFSGLKLVQYHHRNPRNVLERLLLPCAVVPSQSGALLV
jgi:hypothetical protein